MTAAPCTPAELRAAALALEQMRTGFTPRLSDRLERGLRALAEQLEGTTEQHSAKTEKAAASRGAPPSQQQVQETLDASVRNEPRDLRFNTTDDDPDFLRALDEQLSLYEQEKPSAEGWLTIRNSIGYVALRFLVNRAKLASPELSPLPGRPHSVVQAEETATARRGVDQEGSTASSNATDAQDAPCCSTCFDFGLVDHPTRPGMQAPCPACFPEEATR